MARESGEFPKRQSPRSGGRCARRCGSSSTTACSASSTAWAAWCCRRATGTPAALVPGDLTPPPGERAGASVSGSDRATGFETMYYPYKDNAAGRLRSRWQTNRPSEYLSAATEITALASDMLPVGVYREAEALAVGLAGTRRQQDKARSTLIEMVAPPPKRPLYYCQYHIRFLPHWTRDALRDLGDFVDMLVKAAVYEKTGSSRIFQAPLGPAINGFSGQYPGEKHLTDWLRRYNRFLYRPAKHDLTLPAGRRQHRFTSREAVLCVFITMNLADSITALSQLATRARDDQPIR